MAPCFQGLGHIRMCGVVARWGGGEGPEWGAGQEGWWAAGRDGGEWPEHGAGWGKWPESRASSTWWLVGPVQHSSTKRSAQGGHPNSPLPRDGSAPSHYKTRQLNTAMSCNSDQRAGTNRSAIHQLITYPSVNDQDGRIFGRTKKGQMFWSCECWIKYEHWLGDGLLNNVNINWEKSKTWEINWEKSKKKRKHVCSKCSW